MNRSWRTVVACIRSLLIVAALGGGAPSILVGVAFRRFGGWHPLSGAGSPGSWPWQRLWGRLDEGMLADLIVRAALVLAWLTLAVLAVTIIVEVVHQLRFRGISMPAVRGLGPAQMVARYVATGILGVLPIASHSGPVLAFAGASGPMPTVSVLTDDLPATLPLTGEDGIAPRWSESMPSTLHDGIAHDPEAQQSPSRPGMYRVQPGDSIFGIAHKLAGASGTRVHEFANALVDLNLNRVMADGERFTNAAFIQPGWDLQLPAGVAPPAEPTHAGSPALADVPRMHTVAPGESLWDIAEATLGSGERWTELYDANTGRTFDGGAQLDDPNLIQPGWQLAITGEAPAPDSAVVESAVETVEIPVEEISVETVDPDQHDHVEQRSTLLRRDAMAADAMPAAQPEVRNPVVRANRWVPRAEIERRDIVDSPEADESWSLRGVAGAGMLSAGVLALLGVRRNRRLRKAPAHAEREACGAEPMAVERVLREVSAEERLVRIDLAVRSAALPLADRGARITTVLVAPDGEIELLTDRAIDPHAPFEGGGSLWRLAADTPLDMLANTARHAGMPCPALVEVGESQDGRSVYVDLEALEALEIGGPTEAATAILNAMAATLAGSIFAEVTTLVGCGVDEAVFLGHRHHVVADDPDTAFDEARAAIGSLAKMRRSTFDLRSRATSGEAWEPAIVLIGPSDRPIVAPRDRRGLGVVVAGEIHGPSSRLAPDGDTWMLRPTGIRVTPVGLRDEDVAALAELVSVPEIITPEPQSPYLRDTAADTETDVEVVAPEPHWQVLVRLLGPVRVHDAAGVDMTCERSKTRELIAWLATHRSRSTRMNARTAMWESDVRDATFSNVVSEARRGLARLVEPPADDEWIGRTMSEDLPLHDEVLTDVDLIRAGVERARHQPPTTAIGILSPVVELIEGLPFEGTTYLWPDTEGIVSDLVLLAITATTELAHHCLSVGDTAGVFFATGRGLRVLPGHEELIGLRMQAYHATGDLAGVRNEWASYERVLTSDPWSDGEPAGKLVALRAELLAAS